MTRELVIDGCLDLTNASISTEEILFFLEKNHISFGGGSSLRYSQNYDVTVRVSDDDTLEYLNTFTDTVTLVLDESTLTTPLEEDPAYKCMNGDPMTFYSLFFPLLVRDFPEHYTDVCMEIVDIVPID